MIKRVHSVLGIDVGTQSTKCIALDEKGALIGVGQAGYDILTPRPTWAEQEPESWWKAAVIAIREAMHSAGLTASRVLGIGLAGQMHGVVLVGHDLKPLRPAIIWMDRRSTNLIETILARIPPEEARNIAGNRLSPGFAGASMAWLQQVEPDMLAQARAALQPKDYLALRLTGEISSDPSDAAATWLYDIQQRRWSETLAAACGISLDILPPVHESAEVIGTLTEEAAHELGLRAGIPVIAGAGDQAALLLGSGVIDPGRGSITLGTGGQMAVVSKKPWIDPELRLNTFCHAVPDRWYTMGAILNAGIALRWWRNTVGGGLTYPDLLDAAAQVPAGSEGLLFLPYLEGERTPHMNPNASGSFVGLTLRHSRAHLTRAVLEGVAFAFRDCLTTLQTVGPVPDHFLVGGGGAQSVFWRQILATVLNVRLQTVNGVEHTAVGAAVLAGVGAGMFYDLPQAAALVVKYGPTESPNLEEQPVYDEQYERFQALYPRLNE